ncbi:GTP-binding protein [Aquifex sp.]
MSRKIIVGGHFNAGKTTFVNTASEIISLSTEKKISNPQEKKFKNTTTTAMDFGKISLESEEISIFGIPGQERFSFMWEMLSRGASGFIFLVDSTAEELWRDTLKQIEIMVKNKDIPYVVCANKQDLPEAKPVSYVREKLGLPPDVLILPCVAKDRDTVLQILRILISMIDEKLWGKLDELA